MAPLDRFKRSLWLFGGVALLMIVLAVFANVLDTPWLVAIAPVTYLLGWLLLARPK